MHYDACVPKQLTIRGVSDELDRRLQSLSRAQGQSVNATVLQILEVVLGAEQRRQRLMKYATWTREDLGEFQASLADQRRIDEKLWR
jgi:plasmid stability protein